MVFQKGNTINRGRIQSEETRKKISQASTGRKLTPEQVKRMAKGHLKHGMTLTRIYKAWKAMKQRCNNQKSCRYNRYGGRGIKVCKAWRNSFEAFYADMGARPKGLTIDRIDNDGNYELSNCKWSTPKQQANNRVTTKKNPEVIYG